MTTAQECRRQALRILRDVSPDLRAAEELLLRAETEDERERQLRRDMQQLCEPELYHGCTCESEQLQRRMEIYESLHPTAKKGGTPGAGRGKGNKKRECISDESSVMQTESFADNTARKLNTSPRQVQRLVQVARLSEGEVTP